MSGAYKWLGGLGYIFTIIPFLNLVSPILVGLAWLLMGRDKRNGIFTITGILMMALLILSAVILFTLPFFMYFSIMPPAGGFQSISLQLLQLIQMMGIIILLGIFFAGLGLVVFILELISHFRASNVFNIKWFRYAAWLRIVAIVATIIAFALIMSLGLMAAELQPAETLFIAVLGPLMAAVIPWIISAIFSAVAFFTIPEEKPSANPPPSQ